MPSSTHHAPFVTLATRCNQFAQARHLQAWLKHAKTRSLAQTTTACASDSIHHHRIIVLGHFQFQDGISHTAPALTKDGELDSLFSHDLIGYDQARPGDASVAQSQPWPNQVCQVLKKRADWPGCWPGVELAEEATCSVRTLPSSTNMENGRCLAVLEVSSGF